MLEFDEHSVSHGIGGPLFNLSYSDFLKAALNL
jgi:hypothetical protein